MAQPHRPPITCHVLNTVTGLPAASIPVTLTLIKPHVSSNPFSATTNADGRVTSWESRAGGPSLEEVFANAREHGVACAALGKTSSGGDGAAEQKDNTSEPSSGDLVWALTFNVGDYFQGEGFWTEVEVRFKTQIVPESAQGDAPARTHWHVPLLLSPWSYTTYRGS